MSMWDVTKPGEDVVGATLVAGVTASCGYTCVYMCVYALECVVLQTCQWVE